MAVIVTNTAGTDVLTIQDASVDITTPLSFWGYGTADMLKYELDDLYALMENFADTTAPTSPVEGMIWYDSSAGIKVPKYYDGTSWVSLVTGSTSIGAQLSRMVTADNIDFTATGATNLHTGETGKTTIVTDVVILFDSAAPTGADPVFQLEVAAATGDIMDPQIITGIDATTKFVRHSIQGTQTAVAAGEIVTINVVTAAGGTLQGDVYLYGTQY